MQRSHKELLQKILRTLKIRADFLEIKVKDIKYIYIYVYIQIFGKTYGEIQRALGKNPVRNFWKNAMKLQSEEPKETHQEISENF